MLELSAQIPFHLKIKGLNNKKYILKEALRGIVPDEVMFRPKMGFGIPIADWFRNELKEYASEKLLEGRLVKENFFRREYIAHILNQHCTNSHKFFPPYLGASHSLNFWFEGIFSIMI